MLIKTKQVIKIKIKIPIHPQILKTRVVTGSIRMRQTTLKINPIQVETLPIIIMVMITTWTIITITCIPRVFAAFTEIISLVWDITIRFIPIPIFTTMIPCSLGIVFIPLMDFSILMFHGDLEVPV